METFFRALVLYFFVAVLDGYLLALFRSMTIGTVTKGSYVAPDGMAMATIFNGAADAPTLFDRAHGHDPHRSWGFFFTKKIGNPEGSFFHFKSFAQFSVFNDGPITGDQIFLGF